MTGRSVRPTVKVSDPSVDDGFCAEETTMQRWTRRWQDLVAVIAGVYAILAPIWTGTTTKATWTMVVLGAVTIVAALASVWKPENIVSDAAVAVLGVLFFVSPWVMGFSGIMAMTWTAWIVGVVTFIAGALAWLESNRLHHQHVAPTH